MAIVTSTASEAGIPRIDEALCTTCDLCVNACSSFTLLMGEGRIVIDTDTLLGCVGCAQCMAACPVGAIKVSGRGIEAGDIIHLPVSNCRAGAEELHGLMLARRSMRRWKDKVVERERIEKVVEMASTAPMGIPPSEVQLQVFDTKEKVREFAGDVVDAIKASRPVMNLFKSPLGRLILGKQQYEMFRTFVIPASDIFIKSWDEGNDMLFHNAPAAILFHVTPTADPGDPWVAATYAMLAAESLGLGTCMIGSAMPFLTRDKRLRKKYNVPASNKHGGVLLIGYPGNHYKHAIKRRFADVKYWPGSGA